MASHAKDRRPSRTPPKSVDAGGLKGRALRFAPAGTAFVVLLALTAALFVVVSHRQRQRLEQVFHLHTEFCRQSVNTQVDRVITVMRHIAVRWGRESMAGRGPESNRFDAFAEVAFRDFEWVQGLGIYRPGQTAGSRTAMTKGLGLDEATELQRALAGVALRTDLRTAAPDSGPWLHVSDHYLVGVHRVIGAGDSADSQAGWDTLIAVAFPIGKVFGRLMPPSHVNCVRTELMGRSPTQEHEATGRTAITTVPISDADAPLAVDAWEGVEFGFPGGALPLCIRVYPTHQLLQRYATSAHWWSLAAGVLVSLWAARYVHAQSGRSLTFQNESKHHAAALLVANEELSRQLIREKEAANQVHKLTQAIEFSPLSVVITDTDGVVEYVNRKFVEVSGIPKEDLVGRAAPLLEDDRLGREARAALRKAMKTGQEWQLETRGSRREGDPAAEQVSLAPIRDRDAEISHYVFMHTDVTERDRLRQEFLQSQKMEVVGRLAGGVVHDLSNMLTVILGFSQMVQIELGEENPLAEDIDEIIRVGERAAALNRQLLSFARTQTYQAEQMDVNQTLADMDRFLRRTLGEDISLRTQLADVGGTIEIDPGQFNQLMMNLAVNARDAMPEGGELTLNSAEVDLPLELCRLYQLKPGRYVRLEVGDTGVGMSDEVQSRLFEPFFTTKPEGKGTGLGLSTVYGIVRRFKGAIEVSSVLNEGTTFRIYLPLCRTAHSSELRKRQNRVPRGTETVLLVEDDIDVRQLCVTLLGGLGYRVIEAEQADQAIQLAEEHGDSIELIITDVVMPDMNGLELVERLAPVLPNVPVIYTTGFSDHPILESHPGRTDGCLLSKPFSREKLGRTVREALDGAAAKLRTAPDAVVC